MTFYALSRNCLKGLFKLFYSHEVILPENIELPEGAIIAANHASFLDPPLVAISWPQPIHFLARKTLFDVTLLNPIIRGLNAHPLNANNDLSSLKLACKLIQEGKNILIFPEGTRSKTGELTHLKPGIGMLVQRANCPVIPVYIHGSFNAWPKQRRFPKFFGVKTACVIGKPLYFASDTESDRKAAQAQIAKKLEEEIAALRNSYLEKKR